MVVDFSRPIAGGPGTQGKRIPLSDSGLRHTGSSTRVMRCRWICRTVRLQEPERRNRELEMENTFLKKAAAYFACRLQEIRPHAPCMLAAQIVRIIALTALATLGLSGASFHEPFHVRDRYVQLSATVRSVNEGTVSGPAIPLDGTLSP
jgi:hypothetical protein